MNTTARSFVSGVSLFGLLAFLAYAIITQGPISETTTVAFSLVAIYGLGAIALVSYAPFPNATVRVKVAHASRHAEAAPQPIGIGRRWTAATTAGKERSRIRSRILPA